MSANDTRSSFLDHFRQQNGKSCQGNGCHGNRSSGSGWVDSMSLGSCYFLRSRGFPRFRWLSCWLWWVFVLTLSDYVQLRCYINSADDDLHCDTVALCYVITLSNNMLWNYLCCTKVNLVLLQHLLCIEFSYFRWWCQPNSSSPTSVMCVNLYSTFH